MESRESNTAGTCDTREEMRVVVTCDAYNHRRYSRPYIGRVASWPNGGKPEIQWGQYLATHGQAGDLEIMAAVGDIIMHGQRDNRGTRPSQSAPTWCVVEESGLREISKSEARELYLAAESKPRRTCPHCGGEL